MYRQDWTNWENSHGASGIFRYRATLTDFFNQLRMAQCTPGPMAYIRMDMGQQPSGNKMTKETKSQDAKLHQAYRNTNLLIEVS
jgi:hypothetical protein